MTPPRGHQGARERKGMVISGRTRLLCCSLCAQSSVLLNFMEPKLQLERVVRGRDQEPRPCVLSCLAVSTARTPAGAQLRTAGHRVRSRAAAGTASVDTWSEPCGCCAHDGQPPPGPGRLRGLASAHSPSRGPRAGSRRGRPCRQP